MAISGLITAVASVLFLLLVTVTASPHHVRTKRVVKGNATPIEQIPYQVSLVCDNFPICGGTIIREDLVLTAAHCLFGYLPNDTLVYAGMFSKKNLRHLEGIKIKDYRVHEDYNYTGEATPDDIALIVLEKKLTFGPKVGKIALAEENYEMPVEATVSGWGSTNCNFSLSDTDACNGWYATELQSGKLLFTRREDGLIYAPSTKVAGNYGDSGGPVVANDRLIGISRNCDIVSEGVFDFDATSVLDYLPWIRDTIKSL